MKRFRRWRLSAGSQRSPPGRLPSHGGTHPSPEATPLAPTRAHRNATRGARIPEIGRRMLRRVETLRHGRVSRSGRARFGTRVNRKALTEATRAGVVRALQAWRPVFRM